ncbi:MAG: WecB/TagA/CpsF family glycosyltransferase [Spirochaetes bacterium]|nr:WecB/TagA/CpsF family glycosyltransferase [Spirochaetota bacterium]
MNRCKLLGIQVDSISEEDVYDRVVDLSDTNKARQVILLDTYLLMKARFNKDLRNIINAADLVLPISLGIKFGLSFFNKKVEIFNYFSFAIRLLSHFTEKSKNIYILGGSKNIIEKAEKNVKQSFPGIKLMGKYHTKYKKDFEPKLLTAIQKTSPALVLISMNRPKQEKWIAKHSHQFPEGVFIGVENFVEILGGRKASPAQNTNQSLMFSFKKILKRPLFIFDYFIYIFLLFIYKLFNL